MPIKKKLTWWDQDGNSFNKEFSFLLDLYDFFNSHSEIVKAVIYIDRDGQWVYHSSVDRKTK